MRLARAFRISLATLLLAGPAGGVEAQTPKPKPVQPPAKPSLPGKPGSPAAGTQGSLVAPGSKDAAAPQPELPPPYEPKLLRLGEILGTLTYLRDLCGNGDGAEWRSRMSALIDAEGGTQQRKERLAGAFNRGFRGYQFTYHTCTAAAQIVIQRLLNEGDQITRDVASRYAG